MSFFGPKDPTAKPAQSGAEMMLRSMGLGEAIDMAQALAKDGTFNKILEFANKIDQTNTLLAEVRDELRQMRRWNEDAGRSDADQRSGGTANIEPGSDTGIHSIPRVTSGLVDGNVASGSGGGHINGGGNARPISEGPPTH